jgi:hypothetical protein
VIHKATLALMALCFVGCSHAAIHEVCTQDLDRYPALTTSDGKTASPHEVCESARKDEVTRYCVDQWEKNRLINYGSFADCYAERQQQVRPVPVHPKANALAHNWDDEDDDDERPVTASR